MHLPPFCRLLICLFQTCIHKFGIKSMTWAVCRNMQTFINKSTRVKVIAAYCKQIHQSGSELVTSHRAGLFVPCRLWLKEGWPTRTRCGTRSVSSAPAAKLPWPASPSPRRGRVRTVSSASAACTPRSVPAATRPSQVSEASWSHWLTAQVVVEY